MTRGMPSPHSMPPSDSAPASDQREAAGPLVAAIEEAASFPAAFWNRETEEGPTAQLGALGSAARRLCDRLEAAGFLHRVHGSSRRAVILRLSPEGRALLDGLRRQRREDLARVLGRMPPAARTALAAGLSQFRSAAGRN